MRRRIIGAAAAGAAVVAALVLALTFGGKQGQSASSTLDADLNRDLALARAPGLELAPGGRTTSGVVSAIEQIPTRAQRSSPPKKSVSRRPVRAPTPTPKHSHTPAVGADPTEASAAVAAAEPSANPAPAPEPEATVAVQPTSEPAPSGSRDDGRSAGGSSRGSDAGRVIGTVLGVVIRGAVVGGVDNCDERHTGGGTIIAINRGIPDIVHTTFPGGRVGRPAFPRGR